MFKSIRTAALGLALGAAASAGCSGCGSKPYDTRPFTDEEKRKIQEEDRKVADEESQGAVNKAKKPGSR
ncbi:MAG TPA: hypothetical protein VKE74_27000 [Gemmataceae bacterium]|nr:hypothetical protein [Gemmataceae bacterium]